MATAPKSPPKPKAAPKLKPGTIFQGKASCYRVAAWTQSGLVAATYEDDISGPFEYISPKHLYQWMRGIDVYATPEQLEALRAGEKVVFSLKQWA
jgi:hypothetical protein